MNICSSKPLPTPLRRKPSAKMPSAATPASLRQPMREAKLKTIGRFHA